MPPSTVVQQVTWDTHILYLSTQLPASVPRKAEEDSANICIQCTQMGDLNEDSCSQV